MIGRHNKGDPTVQTTQALFDGSVLRPDDALDLKPNTRVRLTIETIEPGSPSGRRPIGLCRGKFTVPPDFDDPLPDDVLDGFEGR